METIFSSEHPPKTMQIERTDDGQLRLVVSLSKLGQNTILEYFLDDADVDALKKALPSWLALRQDGVVPRVRVPAGLLQP